MFALSLSTCIFCRPLFIEAVEALLNPHTIHLNKRYTYLEVLEDSNIIHFSDESTYEADLVIGADGIKSSVRNVVSGDPKIDSSAPRAAFMNMVAYRGLIPAEDLVKAGVKHDFTDRPTCFVGLNKVCIAPVSCRYNVPLNCYQACNRVPYQER